MNDQPNLSRTTTSIGTLTLIAALFTAAKLLGVITWPWWIVTAPIWGMAAIAVVTGLAVLAVAVRR